MLKIFYGTDRVRAQAEIKKLLGDNYEIIEGANLELADLPSVFLGSSLLADERKILIKDLSVVPENFEKLLEYLNTPHQVIVWEEKIDKRTNTYKQLAKEVEIKEFKKMEQIDKSLAFNIYDMAFKDGKKAVEMLEKAKLTEDPYKMIGAWSWKAIDNFRRYNGPKEKRVLKELSKLDMLMKTTSCQPWTQLQVFLLQVSSW